MPTLNIRTENGLPVLDIASASGGNYDVERSTDLQMWDHVTSLTLHDNDSLEVLDPSQAEQQSFYRLRSTAKHSDKARNNVESSLPRVSESLVLPDPATGKEPSKAQGGPYIEVTYHIASFSDAELDVLKAKGFIKEISAYEAAQQAPLPSPIEKRVFELAQERLTLR